MAGPRYTSITRAEDRATQGCDLSADSSADWWGRPQPPRPEAKPGQTSLPESVKSQGRRGGAPDPLGPFHSCWLYRLVRHLASNSSLAFCICLAASVSLIFWACRCSWIAVMPGFKHFCQSGNDLNFSKGV